MPKVIPFAALRPAPSYAAAVAAPPYDVVTSDEAKMLASDNPYSFLHVDKAEIDCGSLSVHDPAVYDKARENLRQMVEQGVLVQDARPCLYIYRLTTEDNTQTGTYAGGQQKTQIGLACCVSVDDYERGLIKKHELTRPDKEQDRVDHMLACEAHTGPIFMAAKNSTDIRPVLREWIDNHAPTYDFTANTTVSGGGAPVNTVRHSLWVVDEDTAIERMKAAFERAPYFYIADGHHRSAAAAVVAKTSSSAQDGRGVFLAVVFPDDELTILDYNRVVRDLNGYTPEAFLDALAQHFTITDSETPVMPTVWPGADGKTGAADATGGTNAIDEVNTATITGAFGLYMGGHWRRLTLKTPPPNDPVDGLAVAVLQNRVLAPLLGILDPKTDARVDFVGGARGAEGLMRRVDSGEMAAAFTVCATTINELMAVADADLIMPPKSTWFEPKLYSGLLIHLFN